MNGINMHLHRHENKIRHFWHEKWPLVVLWMGSVALALVGLINLIKISS